MRALPLLIVLVLLSGCQSTDPAKTPSPSASPTEASAELEPASPDADGVDEDTVRLKKSVIKWKQGQKWELEAKRVDWMDQRSKAKAFDVDWWMLDENDERWVKVVSPEADVDMKEEIVVFTGETVATRLGFPESLRVQKLIYKGKERMFYGSEGVEWRRQNIDLTGETLTATADLDKVQLKGKVKGKTKGGFKGLKLPKKAD